jgi:hypothetical protein
MAIVSARAARTAVFVVALSGAGLWALSAMDAKAEAPPLEDSAPCTETRALFAAKLAYLEARISPEPSQEEAWRTLGNAMAATAGAFDVACDGEPPRSFTVDGGRELRRMESHAAAMQTMFGQMADAYLAVAPSLTTGQSEILSRATAPSQGSLHPDGQRIAPKPGEMSRNCGPTRRETHSWTPPFGRRPL